MMLIRRINKWMDQIGTEQDWKWIVRVVSEVETKNKRRIMNCGPVTLEQIDLVSGSWQVPKLCIGLQKTSILSRLSTVMGFSSWWKLAALAIAFHQLKQLLMGTGCLQGFFGLPAPLSVEPHTCSQGHRIPADMGVGPMGHQTRAHFWTTGSYIILKVIKKWY